MKTVIIPSRYDYGWTYKSIVKDSDPMPMRTAVRCAIFDRRDLSGADLRGAQLAGTDLIRTKLVGADLSGADLRDSNLASTDLRYADLTGAVLLYVDFTDANLSDANLSNADLRGANLYCADLTNANLNNANLNNANLSDIRTDVRAVLGAAPNEVPGLLEALRAGKIDGGIYEGNCACLVGTLANVRGCGVNDFGALRPNPDRAAERWFLALRSGDVPSTSQIAAITEEWIVEWQSEHVGITVPEHLL